MAHDRPEIETKLERLKDDVRLLRDFLPEAAKKQKHFDLDLERQIKELIHDVADICESWLIRKAAVAANNINTTSGRGPLDKAGNTVEREIDSIRVGRLDPMLRMVNIYADLHIVEKQSTEANEVLLVQQNKQVPPNGVTNIIVGCEDEAEILVGCEDEAKILMSYVMEKKEGLGVIAITGMSGIGKTTLAWKIYQNKEIYFEFPIRIWVELPTNFSREDLYISILKELIKKDMVNYHTFWGLPGIPEEYCSNESLLHVLNGFAANDSSNYHNLIHAVRACLETRRFLLVIDDVWTADPLQSIIDLSLNTGKVLITSCNRKVCVDANVTRKPHVLRFLNEKESWDLLQLEAFGKLGGCPEMLKSMGQCIAKNCDGSPLAIVAAGRSLVVTSSTVAAVYLSQQRWKKVSENVLMHVTDNDRQCVFSRVESSYIRLTKCLQDCFLYLGVFPEGHEIPVQTLTRLWIAERLVQEQDSGRLTVEEYAAQILQELIDRYMVMVGKMYPNGQIKTCRLHKVMYGFCKYKAAEQGFYHEIGLSHDRPISLSPNGHRLCIYSNFSKFLASGEIGKYIISILCFDKEDQKVLHPKHSSNIHKSFELLRVLECRCIKFTKFPAKLTKLMHLKYISLSCDDLDVIPETISLLCYLETLIVDTQLPTLKLKANIWRMLQLRHLMTKAAIVLSIRGNGEAGESEAHNNLQTLTRLAPRCCTEDVFTRGRNLKSLGIRGKLADLSDAKPLSKLEGLEKLKLINESAAAAEAETDHDHQLHRLLHPVSNFPQNLKRLTLSATKLELKWMSVLGKIGSLEILKLKNNAFTGESWNTDAGGFRCLGFLLIGTTDLVYWEASADCFPALKWLVLKNCEKLHEIPTALTESLDTLDVENVSESVLEQVRQRSNGNKNVGCMS